jgi:hypothetical protein
LSTVGVELRHTHTSRERGLNTHMCFERYIQLISYKYLQRRRSNFMMLLILSLFFNFMGFPSRGIIVGEGGSTNVGTRRVIAFGNRLSLIIFQNESDHQQTEWQKQIMVFKNGETENEYSQK